MGIYLNTYGTSKVDLNDVEIAKKIKNIFDMRPFYIEKRLKLRQPIYLETASYGHMGRKPVFKTKIFTDMYGKTTEKRVELFTWEKIRLC